jgi:KaiC/GvpD/RAD55 family RecA-like ATPase
MDNKESALQKNWSKLNQEQKDSAIKQYVLDFAELPYERRLEERALYPFSTLNFMTGGMELGEMSIIAGETGSGKTVMISNIVGQIISDGDKVLCIYGESTIEKQQNSAYRQYAPYKENGYDYVVYKKNGKATNIGQYFVDKENEQIVKEKTKGKLYYYKIKLGMTPEIILDVIDYCHRVLGIKYFVIDNVMQLDTENDDVKEVKDAIEHFRRYVIDYMIHIAFVAHYRKGMEVGQIRRRIEEIAGTSAIGNKMATAINVIRLDNIDKKSKQYKSLEYICNANNQNIDNASAVIEVLKTRFNKLGFIALGYNKMKNSHYELHEYNKEKQDKEPVLQEIKLIPIEDTSIEDILPF